MSKYIAIKGFRTALISAALWVGAADCAEAGTVIDFNGGSELASNFAGMGGTQFSQATTGGLSNSGFVDTNPSSDNYAVYQTAINATTFKSARVGGYFLYNGTAISSRPLSFGFTSSATNTYSSSLATSGTDIRVALTGSGSNAGVIIANNGTAVATSSANVPLSAGNWYYMELRIGGVSGGSFTNVEAELFASDSSGNIGSSLKLLDNSGSKYAFASSLATDTSAYAFFGGIGPGSRGIDGVDNLTIIAEPPKKLSLSILAATDIHPNHQDDKCRLSALYHQNMNKNDGARMETNHADGYTGKTEA